MQLKKVHWFYAGTAAIALHAAVFIGANRSPQQQGDESPAAGPPISAQGSTAGILGSEPEELEIEMIETIQESSPREITAEIAETTEVKEATSEVNIAISAPVAPPVEAEALMEVKAVTLSETLDIKEAASPAEESSRQAKTLEAREVVVPEPNPIEKKQREEKKVGKHKRSAERRQAGNSATQGSAGSGGGAGKSRANAGAISAYAAKVRGRVFARYPRIATSVGVAVISFGLTTSGALRYARVTRPSGNREFDQRALASVRGTSFPPPPAGVQASQLRFSISFNHKR
ncbi:TonB family protein [Filomicrobium sp.]|uniref:cell envelope integrity protein TolA n=1 Tax=Filomicrobium sp. TaxID=2024831 RepID=UPI002587713C|nr:TonB family protein [Filomicrobium sp.]MCV0370127.1 TonB family protein [Filomicrobium sp.]